MDRHAPARCLAPAVGTSAQAFARAAALTHNEAERKHLVARARSTAVAERD